MADDPVVWFPPPEPIPLVQPVQQSGSAPLPPPPPPSPYSGWAPAPPPPPRPRRTGLIVGGSIVGGLLLVGAIVGVAVLVANLVVGPPAPVIQSLLTGDPGSPVAVSPEDCPELCFTSASIRDAVLPDAAFEEIGLSEKEGVGGFVYSSLSDAVTSTKEAWAADGGTPDDCFFTYYIVPMAIAMDGTPAMVDDALELIGTHTDRREVSTLTQSVRVFETSQSAVDHMGSFRDQIEGCDSYRIDAGYGAITVTAAPALEVPASVAAIGWVESSRDSRYYAFDVQRSNFVVRTYLYTDGAITEDGFRSLVSQVASNLAELEPKPEEVFEPASGCERECISVEQAAGLSPTTEDLGILGGLVADAANSDLAPLPTTDLWSQASLGYRNGGGDPAVCFFAPSDAPLGRDEPEFFDVDRSTVPIGKFVGGDGTTLTESSRVYAAELVAGRYLGSIRSPIIQCASYSYNDGNAVRDITLTPKAFDTGSDAVASAGWVETWNDQRRSVANLQYANLTVRVALLQGPGSAVTDEQFAEYVKTVAAHMEAVG
ncbi:hypothetical protein BH11ACT5_BH11ACT5_15660 [soil metagenome]